MTTALALISLGLPIGGLIGIGGGVLTAPGILGASIVAGMLAGFVISRKIDASVLRTSIAWSLVVWAWRYALSIR